MEEDGGGWTTGLGNATAGCPPVRPSIAAKRQRQARATKGKRRKDYASSATVSDSTAYVSLEEAE